MRVSPKTWIVFLGLLSVLALAVSACGDATPTATSVPASTSTPTPLPPLKIGVMESLTGPGETYGTVAVQAKQMAVDEINEAGGINGRMLEIIVEDSKCNAQDAITAYRKLTSVDGVKIILGTSCSGAMLGAAPLAEADGVVMFSGLATNPDIANAGDYIFPDVLERRSIGYRHRQPDVGRRDPQPGHDYGGTDYAEGVRGATVAQFEKAGRPGLVAEERYANGGHRLPDPVDQAAERQP